MSELLSTAKENLSFLLVCLLVFAGLCLLAAAAERLLHTRRSVSPARYLTVTALCAALGGVLMLFELPLFFAPSFYKLDLSELPVLFCGFFLGPVAGVVCELLKVVLKLLLKGTTTAFVGDFANFCVGCSMILPATVVYHIRKTKRSALLGMLTGAAALTLMHLYGGRFGVEMPLNCFTGGISLLLGVPGVTLLTVLLLI